MLPQLLFFLLNGTGTLLLETVWLKKQLMLFGNSPGSYGSILFVYFIGVSLGSYVFGRKIPGWFSRPVLFGCFLAAILFSYMVPYLMIETSPSFMQFLYQNILLYTGFKWVVAIIALLPVCFFLGAFFPLVSQTVPNNRFVLLYGIQTLGALAGTYLGAFYLPYHVGYQRTFVVAAAVNVVSLEALYFIKMPKQGVPAPYAGATPVLQHQILAVAGGFIACLLQVTWIRFITIGTDNSIYAFGSASIIILLFITLSSVVISRLPEKWFTNHHYLNVLILGSFAGLILSTWIFVRQTNGLQVIMIDHAYGFFKSLGFAGGFIAVGYLFPSLIFPFVLRMRYSRRDGKLSDTPNAGILIGLNSLGCAFGSLIGAFIFLPVLGIWMTMLICMALYAVLPLLLDGMKTRLAVVVGCMAALLIFNPLSYPLVSAKSPWGAPGKTGSVVSVKEGKYGIVSVIDYGPDERTLWLNNSYMLEAGLANTQGTRRMGILPVLLAPDAQTLAMIGIGTGISASGFINSQLTSMTLIELIPEVRENAKKYFGSYNHGVLRDTRVKTVIADGRQYMKMTRNKYDIIVSDLFTPWNEGTSYLYTRDHFSVVRSRLNHRGIFCLWLPMYQLTEQEAKIIAKTFASVFPAATMWELDASTDVAALALVGSDSPFDVPRIKSGLAAHLERLGEIKPDIIEVHESGLFCRYVAPVDLSNPLWKDVPLNTLDKPVIEFAAAQRNRTLLKNSVFVDFVNRLYALPANPGGSCFSDFSADMENWRRSGTILNQYYNAWRVGNTPLAAELYSKAENLTPALMLVKQGR